MRISTLISYVDDSTVIIQSRKIEENCVHLWHTYQLLFNLFTWAGLVLEHNKTELFHFTKGRSDHNIPLDLGYAPYTGETPLRPKQFLHYLGFFFDRMLRTLIGWLMTLLNS